MHSQQRERERKRERERVTNLITKGRLVKKALIKHAKALIAEQTVAVLIELYPAGAN
jgi:hypothetical protein